MKRARFMWPVEDDSIRYSDAIAEAGIELPRLLAENRWLPASQPEGWEFLEGIGSLGEPTVFLVCELDVFELPAAEPQGPSGWLHLVSATVVDLCVDVAA